MKLLANIEQFNRELPVQFDKEKYKIYFCGAGKNVQTFPLACDTDISEILYAKALFYGHFLRGYHYRRFKSPSLSVEYVREGSLACLQNGRAFIVETGEVFLMQPGQENEIMTGPDGFCVKSSIAIKGPVLEKILRLTGLHDIDVLTDRNTQLLEKQFQLFEEISAKTDKVSMRRNGILSYELLQILREPHEEIFSLPSDLEELIHCMEQDCASDWTTDKMAHQCNCSTAWLIRRFRQFLGTTPYQMLLRFRMEKASKLLLSQNELSIKEISFLCGYSNALNFSTEFRKRYGLSPLQYRRKIFH